MNRSPILSLMACLLLPWGTMPAKDLSPAQIDDLLAIRCHNLVYANGKTSVCFADKFLATAASQTGLPITPKFTSVKLDSEALFDSPFTVISGEGSFRFSDAERRNLHRYLTCGGFLLASPGCSDKEWDRSFRSELKAMFPETAMKQIPMTHAIFSNVFKVSTLTLKSGGKTLVEGFEIDGRLALIYSAEGLNDVANAKGCCCCGGNQISESEQVNVNLLLHALMN